MGEKKRKRMVAEEGGDLFSKLPKDLVVNILLRIPTKEAMATMILSKQWRYLWRNLPCFNFNIQLQNCNNFALLLKKSILPNFLQTLSIDLTPTPCPPHLLLALFNYVKKAVNGSKVATLKLSLFWYEEYLIPLPKALYTCKTLVNLSLSGKILLDPDLSSESCSLSCLKTVKLINVRYKDEESIVSLLSSCPVLEVLVVIRGIVDNVNKFMVKTSSLKEFTYYEHYTEVGDSYLVIDTPSLKRFEFVTSLSRAFYKFQTKMPLDHANIRIMDGSQFPPDHNFHKSMASLITLRMRLTHAMVPCCNTVKFSQLTECKIIPTYSDWLKLVMSLLASSPKLKKLSIKHQDQAEDICWPDSWKEPSCVPKCLSSNFEELKWEEYGHSEVEKQFITYILGNSICLKMVKISILEFEDSREQNIIQDLKHIVRISTTSHLMFI